MNKKAERAMELRSGKNGHYNCAQAVLIPTWAWTKAPRKRWLRTWAWA